MIKQPTVITSLNMGSVITMNTYMGRPFTGITFPALYMKAPQCLPRNS